jgi:hypothetical protein
MRTEVVRTEIGRLLREVPFRRFALHLENGQQIIVEHPENIAFEPGNNGSGGSPDFYVFSRQLRSYGTFKAVTGVSLVDEGERRTWAHNLLPQASLIQTIALALGHDGHPPPP